VHFWAGQNAEHMALVQLFTLATQEFVFPQPEGAESEQLPERVEDLLDEAQELQALWELVYENGALRPRKQMDSLCERTQSVYMRASDAVDELKLEDVTPPTDGDAALLALAAGLFAHMTTEHGQFQQELDAQHRATSAATLEDDFLRWHASDVAVADQGLAEAKPLLVALSKAGVFPLALVEALHQAAGGGDFDDFGALLEAALTAHEEREKQHSRRLRNLAIIAETNENGAE